jgi:hypothetical protein
MTGKPSLERYVAADYAVPLVVFRGSDLILPIELAW